jgi:hypothetical protein
LVIEQGVGGWNLEWVGGWWVEVAEGAGSIYINSPVLSFSFSFSFFIFHFSFFIFHFSFSRFIFHISKIHQV